MRGPTVGQLMVGTRYTLNFSSYTSPTPSSFLLLHACLSLSLQFQVNQVFSLFFPAVTFSPVQFVSYRHLEPTLFLSAPTPTRSHSTSRPFLHPNPPLPTSYRQPSCSTPLSLSYSCPLSFLSLPHSHITSTVKPIVSSLLAHDNYLSRRQQPFNSHPRRD